MDCQEVCQVAFTIDAEVSLHKLPGPKRSVRTELQRDHGLRMLEEAVGVAESHLQLYFSKDLPGIEDYVHTQKVGVSRLIMDQAYHAGPKKRPPTSWPAGTPGIRNFGLEILTPALTCFPFE